jgi:pyroglutamyl-peptidase
LGDDHTLEAVEVPVDYEVVQNLVPSLWHANKPDLTVHIGVSSYDEVTFEQYGHNYGYRKPDIRGKLPYKECCVPGEPDCLKSIFDMTQLQETMKSKGMQVDLNVSEDAGRYLCDFTYYLSLSLHQGPVAFVHVPELDKQYSCAELAAALHLIILSMIEQLDETEVVKQ